MSFTTTNALLAELARTTFNPGHKLNNLIWINTGIENFNALLDDATLTMKEREYCRRRLNELMSSAENFARHTTESRGQTENYLRGGKTESTYFRKINSNPKFGHVAKYIADRQSLPNGGNVAYNNELRRSNRLFAATRAKTLKHLKTVHREIAASKKRYTVKLLHLNREIAASKQLNHFFIIIAIIVLALCVVVGCLYALYQAAVFYFFAINSIASESNVMYLHAVVFAFVFTAWCSFMNCIFDRCWTWCAQVCGCRR